VSVYYTDELHMKQNYSTVCLFGLQLVKWLEVED